MVGLVLALAGCAPKSNPDERWKMDCEKYFSHTPTDYALCQQRKHEIQKHHGVETAHVHAPAGQDLAVRRSRLSGEIDRLDAVNEQRIDELA